VHLLLMVVIIQIYLYHLLHFEPIIKTVDKNKIFFVSIYQVIYFLNDLLFFSTFNSLPYKKPGSYEKPGQVVNGSFAFILTTA
jgi:hypothetical protein